MSAPVIAPLALAVLANEERRRGRLGPLVQVYDARKGFWRTGTLLRLGHEWAEVRTPARIFKVTKDQVRPLV